MKFFTSRFGVEIRGSTSASIFDFGNDSRNILWMIWRSAASITRGLSERAMITHAQADLRKDPSIMRAVVRECDMNFGVGAQVLTPGRVRVGDRVRLLEPGSA